MIIDFHTHILPGIDDGSKDVSMSMQMLKGSIAQGVQIIIATPHFYANRQRIDRFLEEREASYHQLLEITDFPILLGAQVAYFPCMSATEDLRKLCIAGTDILLLELPYTDWDRQVYNETRMLTERYHVVLAHLERFMQHGNNNAWIRQLQDLPLDIQINAESLLPWWKRHSVLHTFHKPFLLGSDMHDPVHRKPNLKEGRQHLSPELLHASDLLGNTLLRGAI